jgi:hypothetical protein
MKNPLVSVIISVFNEKSDNLLLSLNSIINQDYDNIEIILIDDGSKKKIILPKILQNKIKLLRNENNCGLAYSLNKAIELAQGKYILRIDSDDFALSKRTKCQVQFLENNPEFDLVGSSLYIINQNNDLLGLRSISKYDTLLKKNVWKEIPVAHPSWLVKASWIKKNKYNNLLKRGQDQFLLIKFLKKSKYYVISRPLTCYRIKNISIIQRIFGRISIIKGIYFHKEYKILIISIIYHAIALFRDILIKNALFSNDIWNVEADKLDEKLYQKELNSIINK